MKFPKNTPLDLSQLIELHDANYEYFSVKWANGTENEKYMRNDPYTESQLREIESQGRVAYQTGILANKVNQVISHQKGSRTEFKLRAKIDPNDEIKAAIGGIQLRDLEERSNMADIESDVFASGVAPFVGIFEITLGEDEDYNPVCLVNKIDYKDFIWDSNAKTYEKNDALFQSKRRQAYRQQIVSEYGKRAELISENSGRLHDWGRRNENYFMTPSMTNPDFDLLSIFEHYQRVLRDTYIVLFNDYKKIFSEDGFFKFETEDKGQADRTLRELEWEYLSQGFELQKREVKKVKKQKIDKYVFTCEEILEYEETPLEDFPFSIYQSFQYENHIWTLVDLVKSMQLFVDRYFMQIDYSLGKDARDTLEVDISKLAEGFTMDDAVRMLNEKGLIPVKQTGAITNVRTSGANPQYISMVEIGKNLLEELIGGRAFQGQSEGQRQPAKAVQILAQQGEKYVSLFLDNLRRTKKDLGKKLLWHLKTYDTAERIVKVGGGELSPEMLQVLQQNNIYTPSQLNQDNGFVTVNTPTTHLKDSRIELTVTESPKSEVLKDKKFTQLMLLGQSSQLYQELPEYQKLLLETQDLDYDMRQRLLQAFDNRLKAQAEAAKAEAAREDKKLQLDALKIALDYKSKIRSKQ